jgi:hypothetical protein
MPAHLSLQALRRAPSGPTDFSLPRLRASRFGSSTHPSTMPPLQLPPLPLPTVGMGLEPQLWPLGTLSPIPTGQTTES